MDRSALVFMALAAALLISGCVQQNGDRNETTEYEYYDLPVNNTTNEILRLPKDDFSFKVHGDPEFWLKPNKTARFYVVFNNKDGDRKPHGFIARMHPSVADFDVMAGYQCLHFSTCDSLLRDMRDMATQPENPVMINYTFVGLETMKLTVPEDAVKGTYVYNLIACQDKDFNECTETNANWGPNIPVILHIV